MAEVTGEIIDIIKESIKLELNGQSFFELVAEKTHNELGKKMFLKLANDEAQHLKVFSDIFTTMVGEDWKKHIGDMESKQKAPMIDALAKKVESAGKENRASELEAISIAMDLERNAIDFFSNAARGTKDEKARDIFNKIADEERLHYDLLQAQHDYLSNSGYWFDVAEFRMDSKY
ncbi:MAG: ferritin family protein [candidate division WOR-3 bacterium]|nr:MAG: ferritin family protein [candidate division WOR-3 bacterium]